MTPFPGGVLVSRRASECPTPTPIQQARCWAETYVPIVVWAGEGLSGSHCGDRLQDGGLLNVAAWRSLQHVHQVRDEEVVLECSHPLLGQDGGLAAHWAGEG